MRNRTRSTTATEAQYTYTIQSVGGATCNNATVPPYTYTDFYESMSDNEVKSKFKRFNPCRHQRIVTHWLKSNTTYQAKSLALPPQIYCLYTRPYAGHASARTNLALVPLYQKTTPWLTGYDIDYTQGLGLHLAGWADPGSYSSNAVRSMWPGIQSELSLANSFYELKDFSSLPDYLKKWHMLFEFSRKYKSQPLKKIVKLAAESKLQWNFAFAPLISDIQALSAGITGVRRHVNRLLDSEGKILVSHWRVPFPAPSGLDSYSYANVSYLTSPSTMTTVSCTLPNWEAWYTGTMVYSFKLTPYERNNIMAFAALDAFGLNLNPSIIWNALPWSFVVDWFVKVGTFLDQFKARHIEPSVVIYQYCHSLKVKYRRYFNIDYGTPLWRGPYTIGWQDVDLFYRLPTVPSYYSALTLGGMNQTRFELATALTLMRWK